MDHSIPDTLDPATTYPPWSHHVRPHKFDDAGEYRAEIEARTRAGESCKQIATALQAKGIKVSDKTISKRRCLWGLRKRESPATKGKIRPNMRVPRPNRRKDPNSLEIRDKNKVHCKDTIFRLTNEGKTAEEINDHLTEQGMVLARGVASVWRLQTFWKLIPFDLQRSKGTGLWKKNKKPLTEIGKQRLEAKKRKAWRREFDANGGVQTDGRGEGAVGGATGDAAATCSTVNYHYPPNCSFGPQGKGSTGQIRSMGHRDDVGNGAAEPMQIDSDDDESGAGDAYAGYSGQDEAPRPSAFDVYRDIQKRLRQSDPAAASHNARNNYAAEQTALSNPMTRTASLPSAVAAHVSQRDITSADLLVDLASSALSAASKLKDLMLAAQHVRPATGSLSGMPPTQDEVAAWRTEVRDAAGMVVQLANG